MCDTFIALQDRTSDNTVIFGKNSDREPNEPHFVEIYPAKEYLQPEYLKCTYITIPQVERTNRVLLAKPVWIWGAEMGVNEHGVVIGNEAVFSKIVPGKEPGLIGMDYLRLALERASSAKGAKEVITSLLSIYGQSGNCGYSHPMYYHNSFLIADFHEAWILETVGKHWAAKKVESFGAISNALTIGTDWDEISLSLQEELKAKNRKQPGKRINFANELTDWLYTKFSAAQPRLSCSLSMLNKADKDFDVAQAFQILRTHHGDESEYCPDRGLFGADICMHAGFGPVRISQTTGSLVVKLKNNIVECWVTGSSSPCLSLFLPYPLWAEKSLLGEEPSKTYDGKTYWWEHEIIHRKILTNYKDLKHEYQKDRDFFERRLMEQVSDEFWRVPDRSVEEYYKDADRLLKKWISKLAEADIPNETAFLYKTAWEKFNNSAMLPT